MVLYNVDFLALGWQPMEAIAWLSPFHYYPALSVLAGDAPTGRNLAILFGASPCSPPPRTGSSSAGTSSRLRAITGSSSPIRRDPCDDGSRIIVPWTCSSTPRR